MKACQVSVIDYGIGNLLNVVRALEHCGAQVSVVQSAAEINTLPDRLVLPGVGAFADGMAELKTRGFDDVVHRFVATERPFLGICVGAQMLFDVGEEFGAHRGLGVMAGRVQAVAAMDSNGVPHRIPHIGWSALEPSRGRGTWGGTILDGFEPGQAVYFVHSFAPVPENDAHRLADTFYNGVKICAVVAKGSVYGCQFHPERSGPLGLAILKNFLAL